MDSNWRYHREEYYNLVSAIEDNYGEAIKADDIAYTAYKQAKTALYTLEKRMNELAESVESFY